MAMPFVMLVDDEVQFVETMAKRLADRGIDVIKAFTAEEGLEKLKTNENLDIIILDIKMPGMNGIEALKEIKAISPLIEVIMLTGNATIQYAIDAMKLGAYDFLMKPFELEELFLKIKAAANNKQEHENKIKDALKQETLSKYGPFSFT